MEKNLLAGFKFFNEVPPESLEAIGRKGELLEFGSDDIIFRFDEPAEHLYGLVEGRITNCGVASLHYLRCLRFKMILIKCYSAAVQQRLD